jgi:uncharacterized protein
MGALTQERWNPYVVGVGIGLLSCVSILTMNKLLGTSSSYVHVVAAAESLVAPERVFGANAGAYFAKEITEKTPLFDWQFFLVVAVFVGAFISHRLTGRRGVERVPGLWAWRFGPSQVLRYTAAFLFGAVMLYGARLAGGCTSGHAISGGLQLALSSWVFFVAFFASGIVTAFTLFGVQGRAHVAD